MSLREVGNWLESTSLSHLIQRTHGAIADIQVVHIICLATLFALALNFALRIAGRGLSAESLASLAGRLLPGIWICLGLLLLTGGLLIVAEPGRAIRNKVFYIKMALVLVAVILTFWLAALSRRPAQKPKAVHVFAAGLYMLVWTGIIVAGRLIAYSV
jgi:hypothetical protein